MQAFISNTSGNAQCPIYFDLYVFSIKKMKDSTLYDTVGIGEMAQFFRPSTAGNDTTYAGRVYNYFQNVNTDVISVVHKRRFKMSPTNLADTGAGLNGSWVDNYSQFSINHTVPLSKHVAKTLKYTNTTDENPNNCALFATLVCTRADATVNDEGPTFTGGLVSFNSCMVYEDA